MFQFEEFAQYVGERQHNFPVVEEDYKLQVPQTDWRPTSVSKDGAMVLSCTAGNIMGEVAELLAHRIIENPSPPERQVYATAPICVIKGHEGLGGPDGPLRWLEYADNDSFSSHADKVSLTASKETWPIEVNRTIWLGRSAVTLNTQVTNRTSESLSIAIGERIHIATSASLRAIQRLTINGMRLTNRRLVGPNMDTFMSGEPCFATTIKQREVADIKYANRRVAVSSLVHQHARRYPPNLWVQYHPAAKLISLITLYGHAPESTASYIPSLQLDTGQRKSAMLTTALTLQ